MSAETSVLPPAFIESSSGKLANIQALRGLAIAMVLCCHIGKYEEDIFSLKSLLPSMTFTGRAGVDLFFVISGFIMVTITGARSDERRAGSFLLRRVARIYPLYWFYSLIYLPIFLIRPELLSRPTGAAGIDLARSFFLIPAKADPLLGQGWTLVHEMYFYLVFALLLLRPRRELFRLLLVWACIVGIVAFIPFSRSTAPPILRVVFNPLTLEFLAGCGVAWLVKQSVNRAGSWAIFVGGFLFFAIPFLVPDGPRALLFLIPGSLLVYGAVALERQRIYFFPLWLRYLGDISYSLYLSHILVLAVVKKGFRALNLHEGLGPNLLFIVLAAAVCVLVGAASFHGLEKPFLRFVRKRSEARHGSLDGLPTH